MDWGLLIIFATTFASVLALPGPNAAFAVGQSLRYGARKSLAVAVGFMLATCVHITSSGAYSSQAVALIVVAMAISFSIYATYIVGASKLGEHLRGSKWANKIVAVFYLGAAGVLASKST